MKDFSKLSTILIFILISSTFAKSPKNHFKNYGQSKNKYKNKTHQNNRNAYTHYNYDKKDFELGVYINEFISPFTFTFGSILLSIWVALFLLYFALNRRKSTFTVMIQKQVNNLSGYMNV